MNTRHDAVLATNAAYERDAGAWAARLGGGGFLTTRFQRFRDSLPPGSRVLDVGCGPGADAALLLEMGLNVIALDLTSAMLHIARERRKALPVVQGDSRALPFPAAVFDGIWASASLLHLPKSQIDIALREVRRTLRAQGVLHSFMKVGDHDGLMTQEQRGGGNPVRGARYFAHYQPAEWSGRLRDAHFEVVEQRVENVDAQLPDTPWLITYARAST